METDIKQRMEAQAIFLIRLPFAHRANGSLLFVRFLAKKKQTEVTHLKRAKRTCLSM